MWHQQYKKTRRRWVMLNEVLDNYSPSSHYFSACIKQWRMAQKRSNWSTLCTHELCATTFPRTICSSTTTGTKIVTSMILLSLLPLPLLLVLELALLTAQRMKKVLMENFIFCSVTVDSITSIGIAATSIISTIT